MTMRSLLEKRITMKQLPMKRQGNSPQNMLQFLVNREYQIILKYQKETWSVKDHLILTQ